MTCGLAALLRPGGPVRVPLRECCAAALVGADGVTASCEALQPVSPPSGADDGAVSGDALPVRSRPGPDVVPVLMGETAEALS